MATRKPYWIDALLEDGTELQIGRDGLLYRAPYRQAKVILADYPRKGDSWYFNDSFDRQCAEIEYDDFVIINPSIIAKISPLLACNN